MDRILVPIRGEGAKAHVWLTEEQNEEFLRLHKTGLSDLECLTGAEEAFPNTLGDFEEMKAESSKEDKVQLSISNEELEIHLSFWATKAQEAKLNRLMDIGLTQREAMKIVFPPKNKTAPTPA